MKKITMLIMVISWSIYFVLCDILIKTIGSPILVGALLRIGTFVLLSSFMYITKRSIFRTISNADLKNVLITGIIAFIYDFLINVGLMYSSATAGSSLLKIEIVFVILINRLFGKDKISFLQMTMSLIMMIGAFLIVIGAKDILSFDYWSLLFVLSAFLNAVCAFMLKKVQSNNGPDGYQVAFINNLISMVIYSLLYIMMRDVGLTVLREINPLEVIGCVVCQAVLITTYYSSLGNFPVWVVKVVVLAIPVLTLIIQASILRMGVSLLEILGISITIASGIVLLFKGKV